jgi:hypothetical protein
VLRVFVWGPGLVPESDRPVHQEYLLQHVPDVVHGVDGVVGGDALLVQAHLVGQRGCVLPHVGDLHQERTYRRALDVRQLAFHGLVELRQDLVGHHPLGERRAHLSYVGGQRVYLGVEPVDLFFDCGEFASGGFQTVFFCGRGLFDGRFHGFVFVRLVHEAINGWSG